MKCWSVLVKLGTDLCDFDNNSSSVNNTSQSRRVLEYMFLTCRTHFSETEGSQWHPSSDSVWTRRSCFDLQKSFFFLCVWADWNRCAYVCMCLHGCSYWNPPDHSGDKRASKPTTPPKKHGSIAVFLWTQWELQSVAQHCKLLSGRKAP